MLVRLVAGVDKEARVKQLHETIGTHMLRVGAVPNMSPEITNTMNKIRAVIQALTNSPTTVFSNMMEQLTAGGIRKVIEVLATRSNSTKNRVTSLARVFFRQDFDSMDEQRKQALIAEALTTDIVEAAMVAQFSDGGGNIKWVEFSTEGTRVMAEKIAVNAAAAAAAAANGLAA